jgi:hypothetical protein
MTEIKKFYKVVVARFKNRISSLKFSYQLQKLDMDHSWCLNIQQNDTHQIRVSMFSTLL